MAIHEGMGEFSPHEEEWVTYVECLLHYCRANDIVADKKLVALFSVCGPLTYKLIKNLATHRSPSDLSFDSVVDLVMEHYSPKPSVIVQHFKINSRLQQPGETVATFVTELRRLSQFCKYGEMLDEMLRDRLVCGIQQLIIQR